MLSHDAKRSNGDRLIVRILNVKSGGERKYKIDKDNKK